MGEYDAASLVGQMAGLNNGEPAKKPVTPEDLIGRFCDHRAAGLTAARGTTEKDGVRISRGWCGYIGGRGDSLVVGFDEGYDFMGYLADRGWRPLPAKGDWPYVVYLSIRDGEGWAVAEYCETDLTVWQFSDDAQFREFYGGLKDTP